MPAICAPISSVARPVCAGQRLDLAGDHGKAAPGLAGARRLDGRIERQKIGLLGDIGDELDHVADALGGFVELLDRHIGALGFAHRLDRDGVRLRHLAVDLVDRNREFVGGRRDVAHIGGGLRRTPPPPAWSLPRRRRRRRRAASRPPASGRRYGRARRASPRRRRRIARSRSTSASADARATSASPLTVRLSSSFLRMAFWNTPIERASAPISSRRSRNGTSIAVSPAATVSVTPVMAASGLRDVARNQHHAGGRQHHGEARRIR